MPVRYYFDHNVKRAVAEGLRLRDVDVLTALEDGSHQLADSELLDRATALGRVLFSTDHDLIIEARRRQREGVRFAGVIFGPQRLAIGLCVQQLEFLAKTAEPDAVADSLLFLPLPIHPPRFSGSVVYDPAGGEDDPNLGEVRRGREQH